MEELEKLKNWLQTYPGWEGELLVDYTKARPGHFGLYPQGLEQRSVRQDVLGNTYVRCRSRYALYRVTTGQADNSHNAAWLLDFQNWVREQSAQGLAPAFGDLPAEERLTAQQGRLKKTGQTGTGTYAVTITAEYTKVYAAA